MDTKLCLTNLKKKKIKLAEHQEYEEGHFEGDGHDHSGGEIANLFNPNARNDFFKATQKEKNETKIIRNFLRSGTAKDLAESMGLKGTRLTSVSGDLMGVKGQAFAVPGENRFFYSRDDWTPGVMAHEMGHLASNKTDYGKATSFLGRQGGALGAIALGVLAGKSKGLSRKIFGGSALASAAAPHLGTYLQEVDAWEHADKALDDLEQNSYFYDAAARDAARNTREKALDTYSTVGIVNAGIGAAGAGAGAVLGAQAYNKTNPFRGNLKAKLLGLGALGLTLGSPVSSYILSKQLDGENPFSKDVSDADMAHMYGGFKPETEVV